MGTADQTGKLQWQEPVEHRPTKAPRNLLTQHLGAVREGSFGCPASSPREHSAKVKTSQLTAQIDQNSRCWPLDKERLASPEPLGRQPSPRDKPDDRTHPTMATATTTTTTTPPR